MLFEFSVLLRCPSRLKALKIADKHRYNIYDALVVSAALEAGCTTLYSEDLRDGQTIGGQLTIRNPFVGSVSGRLSTREHRIKLSSACADRCPSAQT